VSPVKYVLGFYVPEDDILHSDCRENVRTYMVIEIFVMGFELSFQILFFFKFTTKADIFTRSDDLATVCVIVCTMKATVPQVKTC
jgi:hypothetical protein